MLVGFHYPWSAARNIVSMSKHTTATFREAHPEPPFWRVRFEMLNPPRPGCFLLADFGAPLREVLFPAALHAEGFDVLVPPGHPVQRLLPGEAVDLLGPFGRGFQTEQVERLLLVAEAHLLPPLLPLLEAAPMVTLVLAAPTRALLPPAQRFPPAVELHLITQDGSVGYAGTLETCHNADSPLLEAVQWADRLCASCDPVFYPKLARIVRQQRLNPPSNFAQVLIQVAMPCGVGACEICRVQTVNGERRACTDGPVFDVLDFVF